MDDERVERYLSARRQAKLNRIRQGLDQAAWDARPELKSAARCFEKICRDLPPAQRAAVERIMAEELYPIVLSFCYEVNVLRRCPASAPAADLRAEMHARFEALDEVDVLLASCTAAS